MTLKADMLTDIDTFISNDEFAVAITYTPTGGSPATIYGIFDAPYEQYSPLEQALSGLDQSVLVKASAVASLKNNEPMVIGGVTYRTNGPGEPDGTGMMRIKLVK